MIRATAATPDAPIVEGFDVPEEKPHPLIVQLDEGNIVGKLDDLETETAAGIYEDITTAYDEAEASMDVWLKKYNKALKLAKMQPSDSSGQDIESKSFPFEGASLAMMPFIIEAMLDFSSRASPELVWTDEIVSASVNGMDRDQQKQARADRVSTYMNYQLTNDIPGWRDGQDKNVLALPCVGTTYKKTYYDFDERRVCSDFRMADKVIFDLTYDTFEEAPNKFEPISYRKNDVIAFIRGEQQWDLAEDDLDDDTDEFDFIEAHCWIDLDEDGLKEPYCAILFPELNKIVALYPDYDEDTIVFGADEAVIRIRDKEVYTQYKFLPDPCGGPMGMGWGILLGPTFTAINTLIRDNLDAGTLTLTSSNSGLIAQSVGEGRGNRQLSSQVNVVMGQLTPYPIGAMNGSLRDNVVQFPFAGASPVLFQLTEYLVEASRRMTNAAYNVEANDGEAASLYLARLQQGLKVPNSIIMRVYACARKEFEKIGLLNFKHYDSYYYNKVLDEEQQWSMEQDFNPEDCDIDLVADPAQGSDFERIARAQNAYSMATEQAGLGQNVMSLREVSINLLKSQGYDDAEVERMAPPPPEGPSPMEKLMLAQQQFEAEIQDRELKVKESKQRLEEAKLQVDKMKSAMQAARELSELGLKADLDEATITEKYANALKGLVKDAGLSFDQAKREVIKIERDFIGDNDVDQRAGNALA